MLLIAYLANFLSFFFYLLLRYLNTCLYLLTYQNQLPSINLTKSNKKGKTFWSTYPKRLRGKPRKQWDKRWHFFHILAVTSLIYYYNYKSNKMSHHEQTITCIIVSMLKVHTDRAVFCNTYREWQLGAKWRWKMASLSIELNLKIEFLKF